MLRGAGLLSLGLACLGFVQAQPDWRFAHPNADMRISFNVQTLLKAPSVIEALHSNQNQAETQLVVGFLSSIDRISVSSRETGKDSDVLVLVTGNFDSSSIQSMFPSSGTSQVKQVGPHAVLIGEAASFSEAVQRMAGEAPAGTRDELEQSDIWVAGSSDLIYPQQGSPAPPALKAMRTFSLGLNLGDSPEINVALNAIDADGAAQILSALREIMGPLGQALDAKQGGPKVRLHFPLPPEIIRMAQAQALSGSLPEQLQPLMGLLGLAGPK